MIIKNKAEEIQNYLNDVSNFHGLCESVFIRQDESEISSILKEAES